jgi:acetyl esterase/lipase
VVSLGVPVEQLSSGVNVHHGVEYASIEGYRPLLLDLYLPPTHAAPDPVTSPAIVYLHGGGWAVGTRRRFGRAFAIWQPTPLERLAVAGFAVAAVDYRLSGETRFPGQLHDVKAAIRWMRGHAAALGVDTRRIIAWGESAGGHLAALAGLTGDQPALEGDVGSHLGESSGVCGIVDWYGPMNLLSLSRQLPPRSDKRPDDAGSWESLLVGSALQEDPLRTQAASPIHYVHGAAPPIQIHHGTADSHVPFAQSVEFADAVRAAGGQVELVAVDGSDHFWLGAPDVVAIFDASLSFARRLTAR